MPTENTSSNSAPWLTRFGRAMRTHQRRIAALQWAVVALYALLLLLPLFAPLSNKHARLLNQLQHFSLFLFWGIGWPLIFLSMMLVGRVWCGIFCPDGTLTELVSRHGRQQSIPRWIRWSGWPCAVLVFTTLYGQMVGVYESFWGTLLLLGIPTLGALYCGYAYANGKRIWCMYLCPANGPFGLLAKIAPFHFRVDETKWQQHPPPLPRVDCPPLIDIRRMKSASPCHMCGRCAGHLDAVELAARSPDHEILHAVGKSVRTSEAITLIFGLLGVCTAAIQWRSDKWYGALHAALGNSFLAAIQHDTAPWWLLMNHPAENQVFNLLDGLSLLLYVLVGGILLGLTWFAVLKLATTIVGDSALSWQKLSLALIPLGGMGMFLGLVAFTVNHLKQEGFSLDWVPWTQFTLLVSASVFSLWLGAKLIGTHRSLRHMLGFAIFSLAVALLALIWVAKLF